MRNYIHGLYDKEGCWQEDEHEIEDIICDYYRTLFNTCRLTVASIDEVSQDLELRVTADMNEMFSRPCIKDEAWAALSQMP